MEDNNYFYKEEYGRLATQIDALKVRIDSLKKQIEHQQELLNECYERIHYKRAWLTLSDENIDGMEKHIKALKEAGEYEE
jgi:peptidoglycan hydrolase CwlO-like protein